MEGQRNIELSFNGNSKVVGLTLSAAEDNWNSLAKKVCTVFDLKEEQAPGLKMKYTDEEGDLITLDSDDELRQALLHFDTKTPKFEIMLTSASLKDQQRRISKEERMKRKEERVKAKQARIERKKLKLAMKQEWKLRQEEAPAGTVLSDDPKELAKKQAKLARREERLQRKAERLARRSERRGDAGCPMADDRDHDAESRLKRREEKEARRQARILKRQEKEKKRKACSDEVLPSSHDNAGASAPTSEPSKEERRMLREERKKMRCEEREARKQAGHGHRRERRERPDDGLMFYSLEEKKVWPEDATQLYLDGNNMMFLTAALRNMTLNRARGGASKAEALLESVADAFVASMNDRIKQAVLIFDHTHTEKIKTFPNGTTLRVCSARPRYPTSDDALIDWAKQAAAEKEKEKEQRGRMVFVTSDRGLSVQLQQAGGLLIKPKQFLHFACQTVTGTAGESSVDAWLDSLLA